MSEHIDLLPPSQLVYSVPGLGNIEVYYLIKTSPMDKIKNSISSIVYVPPYSHVENYPRINP